MTETLRFSDAGDASEGELVSWLVEPGDHVAAGDLVAEVETDKSLVEVTASVDSVVESLSIEEGSVVAVGDALATVDPDADADSSSEADASSESDASPETDAAAADPVDEGGPDEAAVPSGRVFAPPSVRRLARERDVDLTAVEGTGPSGRITAGDVTDHVADRDAGSDTTADESSSPKPLDLGSDDRQSAVRGQEASAGVTDAEADESSGPTPLDIGSDDRSSAVQSRTAPSRSTTLATPATRRLADELDVDLDRVPTDETRDGEAVVDEDRLRAYAAELAAEEGGADAVTTGAGVETGAVETASTDTAVPPSTSPTAGTATTGTATVVYDTATVDAVLAARDRLASRAADGDRPSLLAFVAKAVAVGLERYPALGVEGAEAEGSAEPGPIHVGVTTADGLATTLVENAADRGVFELTAATTVDGDAAEDGGPAGSDGASSAGPAFTLTAPGALGRDHVAPAVTDSAPVTLALGAVEKRPTVREASDGTADVVAASTIPLSLAVDPSVADGAAAAAFLETVIERLEEPLLFLTHQ
ncbi:2-oxo acid dehydrogenase subunit E2 [Halorubrum sp. SY-15]|uniref:2-oxo acid dehydrogenase subunit E2 n=1 Tax=Halorubrum sp. SY-15 TaxID=3402277 RepID=UPI003EB99E37